MDIALNVRSLGKDTVDISIALPYFATEERLSAIKANAPYIGVAYQFLTGGTSTNPDEWKGYR